MRNVLVLAVTLLLISTAFAGESVPFGGELQSDIRNYNRASSMLATSGELGEGAVEELAQKGLMAIIDLRLPEEGVSLEAQKAEKAGLHYFNIPVSGTGINETQLSAFKDAYESLKGPVLVHCRSGNRVGAMLARYYAANGAAPDVALARGRAAGLKPALEEKIVTQSCDLNTAQAC